MAYCSSCGAQILWGKTRSGKAMPLDAEPDPNGSWGLDGDRIVNGTVDPRYTSHFATCPNASSHRKT